MTIFQAIFLGFLQGVTEFLPVSSSGHLAVFQILMGLPNQLLFDVLLHIATLGAILWFFRQQIIALRWKQWLILGVATIPAALAGVLLGDFVELAGNTPVVIMLGFFITAGLNFFSQYKLQAAKANPKPSPAVGFREVMSMGLTQAIALLPGISRSGTTVATGLGLLLSRQDAFHWSFLLAIPAIVGATGWEVIKIFLKGAPFPALLPTVIGMITAFIAGLASLYLLELMLRKAVFWYFGVYSLVMALIMFVMIARAS